MKMFNAYCKYCEKVVSGKTTAILELDSGNFLYTGECVDCFYEVKRIVTKKSLTSKGEIYGIQS